MVDVDLVINLIWDSIKYYIKSLSKEEKVEVLRLLAEQINEHRFTVENQ